MFIIVNPVAGRGRGRKVWPELESELRQQGLTYTTVFTEYPGHAKELSIRAVQKGFQTIITVGGDGTLSEVVNGIAEHQVALGLIPVGSGNDFARSIQISSDLAQAVKVIAEGAKMQVDLGTVGDAYFINIAGVGFDAQVAATMAERARWLKGTTAYIYAVLRSLASFKAVPVRLTLDGKVREVNIFLVAVANGRYFGGGMQVAPTAQVDDGFFDVVVLEDLSRFAFLQAFPSVFKGEHLTHPKIKVFRARQVAIEPLSVKQVPAQAEGNFYGYAPKEFRILPRAQEVLVPKAVAQVQSATREELAIG